MPKDDKTADLFEADGVTPIKAVEKPVITEAQLEAERRAARAEGEVAGLKSVAAAKPEKTAVAEKVFTRAELRGLVNEGKITEDAMDETLERQSKTEMLRLVDEKVAARVSTAQTATKIEDQIAAYVGVFPDINTAGSALRAKIEAEFQDLVANKSPNTLSTELAAIKIVCGKLNAGTGRRPGPDAHEDVGSGGTGSERPDTTGPFKGLSTAQKKHYEKMIERGMYKSASDPRLLAEVKYARKAH